MPDFRSLGVIARILVAANAAGLAAAMLRSESIAGFADSFARIAATLEPVLLCALALFYALSPSLAKMPYAAGLVLVLAIGAALAAAMAWVTAAFTGASPGTGAAGNALYALLLGGLLGGYFRLRERAFSPALAEARLQALQARIRPHFLFNSLNAVLHLVRRDPKRAESALENLADLFRSVMAEPRELVTLAEEISLTRQYLDLEHLRLGERLVVEWSVDREAEGALVPPMLLQPLVENAVYHGIEPGAAAGTIRISARRDGERLRLVLSNPYHADYQHRQGNRMALANIDERLALHFDLEAVLQTRIDDGRFDISIDLPLRKAAVRA